MDQAAETLAAENQGAGRQRTDSQTSGNLNTGNRKEESQKPGKKGVLRKLFFSTLYLSAFTFGGGYVIVTLLKETFVDKYHWIEEDEMLDLVAIAQSSPGAIAINGSIVVGYKLAGIPGVLVAVLGAVIPPMLTLSIISFFYKTFISNPYVSALLSGMRAGVGAVIVSVVYDMGKHVADQKDYVNDVIMVVSFLLSYFLNVNTIYIILAVAAFGFFRTLIRERKNK